MRAPPIKAYVNKPTKNKVKKNKGSYTPEDDVKKRIIDRVCAICGGSRGTLKSAYFGHSAVDVHKDCHKTMPQEFFMWFGVASYSRKN